MTFLNAMPMKAKTKMLYNIGKSMYRIDREVFKKLTNSDISEFRTLYDGVAYRLFAFWDVDGETLVIATHGIVKKKRKTPAKEIERAEKIMKEYFKNKRYGKDEIIYT